jgi:secondary thiamine-phosphate synthase enzyme
MWIELSIQTQRRTEFLDFSEKIQAIVGRDAVDSGICHIFVPHTTAGLTLNENWDPAVQQDILQTLDRLIPTSNDYKHTEGNSAAHIKATLIGFSASLPVQDSKLLLGTWQGIYLAEFDGPRTRRVLVKVMAS